MISFAPDDSIRHFLGFNADRIQEKLNLFPNRLDILSFGNLLLETVIAQGKIFNGNGSRMLSSFRMDVDPVLKYIEKFCEGGQWYTLHIIDFLLNIKFKLKNENNELVYFNGQSITFRLSLRLV